jgi:hypothetical protein
VSVPRVAIGTAANLEKGHHDDIRRVPPPRWYAVGYEGIDPLTRKNRHRWHRATDENDVRRLADTLPSATTARRWHTSPPTGAFDRNRAGSCISR